MAEEEKPIEKQEKTTVEKISSIYLDKGGFGSLKDTYNDVSKIYPELLRSVLALVSEVEQNDNSLYTVG